MENNIINYGEVSDELCPNCRQCSDYELSYDYNYSKFLFISFRERNRKYYLRCKNCRVYSEIDRPKAQYMIDSKFSEIESRRKRTLRFKNAVAVLVICAVISAVLYGALSDPDMYYKSLVADKPNGYYEVYDKNGKIWAQVTKDGIVRYDLLVKRETVDADDYSNLSEDLYFYYFYREQEGGLEYIEETAAVLCDKLGVTLRYYFYDPEEEDIFYYFGVDDIDRITYSGSRGIYDMTYYAETNEHYTKVYEKNDDCETVLMFGETALERIDVYTWDGGRVAMYESYYAPEGEDMSPELKKIDKHCRIEDILAALKESGIKPAYSETYTYYKDTGVTESVYIRSTDAGTGINVSNNIKYIVEEKGGFYIVAPDVEKFGEKMAAGTGAANG